MINSKIITNCINELENFGKSLLYVEGNDQKSEGYNCAVDCVRDSLKARVDSLKEGLIEYDPEDCIDDKCECYNEIASMLDVLNADCESLTDGEFDKAFEEKMRECIRGLHSILEKYA